MARKLGGAYFARLALDYFDHPKIGALSDSAIVAHLEMIVYCRRYLTNGAVPKRVATRFAKQTLEELASNDPERPSIVINDDGSVTVHDYADAQETREEIESKRQVRAEAGAKGGKASKQNAQAVAKQPAKQTASKTQTEEEEEEEISSAIPDRRPDVDSLCSRLADHIEANGSKRPTIGKAWTDAARLILDRDKRPIAEAERLIDWSQQDEFWRTNILSMSKFRTQYDQLKLKAGPATTPRPNVGKEEWMNYA